MSFSSDERGDTLIEVLIAVTVLSIVLISLYGLLNDAFKLSIQARERTQATNYLQQQSEGLRAMRDTMDWGEFENAIDSASDPFHVEPATQPSGETAWEVANDTIKYKDLYTVGISEVSSAESNRRLFQITVNWDRFGGGGEDTTTAEFTLSRLEFNEFPVGTNPTPPSGGGSDPQVMNIAGSTFTSNNDEISYNLSGTSSDNRLLMVAVSAETSYTVSTGASEINSIKYDDRSLSRFQRITIPPDLSSPCNNTGYQDVEIWYMLESDLSSADPSNEIEIDWSGSPGFAVAVTMFENVDQSNPLGYWSTYTNEQGGATTCVDSVSLTSSNTTWNENGLGVDAVGIGHTRTITPGTDQTQLASESYTGGGSIAVSTKRPSDGSAFSMSNSFSGDANRAGYVLVILNPVSP